MADLAPIAGKLAKYIRLLSSDKPGEVVAAAEAIMRVLRSAGADIHALADMIENPRLSEAEMKMLYESGFEDGLHAAAEKHHNGRDFVNVDGLPSWHEIARYCQRNNDRLNDWERSFIDSITSQTVWREPKPKQEKCLRSIFFKLGGRI